MARATLTYEDIRMGDRVTILRPAGITWNGNKRSVEWKQATGRAVMLGPVGWVLNMGGRYGVPAIASRANIVSIRRSK